jgi:hypothetical protein
MEQQQQAHTPLVFRRRASSRDALDQKAAGALVAATQLKLDQWHRRTAFLKAKAPASTLDREAVREEAGEQLALVVSARIALEGEIAHASLRGAQHSLVRDVLRSLRQLQVELLALSAAAWGSSSLSPLGTLTQASPTPPS